MKLTVEQALQQAVAAHNKGKLQDAERLYLAILQSQPRHPEANYNLGLLALSVNKADAALPLFKTALEANPNVEQFWLSYIDALAREHKFEKAKQVIEDGKKQGLAGKKLNTLEAQLFPLNEKKSDETADPSLQQLDSLLDFCQNGQFYDAEKLALSITQKFPEHHFAWKVLGVIFGQSGRYSEAVNASQNAVKLAPKDAEAHSDLGIMLTGLGRLDEAEASCRRAIALKPDYAKAHNNLGNTLKELRKYEKAEESYVQAIALKPDYAEAHYNLGITLRELGRLSEAEASFSTALELKPDFVEAHNNLGLTCTELGKLDEAEASCRTAIALKSDFADAHSTLGEILLRKGRHQEGINENVLGDGVITFDFNNGLSIL